MDVGPQAYLQGLRVGSKAAIAVDRDMCSHLRGRCKLEMQTAADCLAKQQWVVPLSQFLLLVY